MKEKEHLIQVLNEAVEAVSIDNSLSLHNLSDQTIHSASIYQHTDYTITAIIIYALSKIIERKSNLKIKNWNDYRGKIISLMQLAIKSLKDNNQKAFLNYLEQTRKTLTSSVSLKPYILEVLTKASINKGAKIYEHGISLEQTSKLLGLTQWELTDYIGSREPPESGYNRTMKIKERARMALEFFD